MIIFKGPKTYDLPFHSSIHAFYFLELIFINLLKN